jgi:hypothetical protein
MQFLTTLTALLSLTLLTTASPTARAILKENAVAKRSPNPNQLIVMPRNALGIDTGASLEKRGNIDPSGQMCAGTADCPADYPYCICASMSIGYQGAEPTYVYACSNENCDACVPDDC